MSTRNAKRLTALLISNVKAPGHYPDGDNLFLQVTTRKDGGVNKSFVLRFRSPSSGRKREMGLGITRDVSLAVARDKAAEARALVAEGIDPIDHRDAERIRLREEAAAAITFQQAAESVLADVDRSSKSDVHKQQWRNTLEQYVYPEIGKLPMRDITTDHLLAILEPIWTDKNETARRIRQRIERVIDWATARKYRKGENPARWKGNLQQLLPTTATRVQHHAAMPFSDLPEFMADLRQRPGISARALEFTILTAARTGEVINARWCEVDLANAVWTIPAARMKAAREHKVPLSPACVSILTALKFDRPDCDWLFPSINRTKPLSSMAMLSFMQSTGQSFTVHGFRSTFRDWVSEKTDYSGEVAEAALAHVVRNKVEAAYRRGDLMEKRRRLMNDWASYCVGTAVLADNEPLPAIR